MDQPSVPMRHVIFPVAFIDGAISPLLDSSAISFIILPLALIDIFFLELDWAQVLSILNFKLVPIVDEQVELLLFLLHHLIRKIRHLVELDPAGSKFLVGLSWVEFGGEDRDFLLLVLSLGLLDFFIANGVLTVLRSGAVAFLLRLFLLCLFFNLNFVEGDILILAGGASFSHLEFPKRSKYYLINSIKITAFKRFFYFKGFLGKGYE